MNPQQLENREITTEQYKVEVLKGRVAKLVSDYEETIANYEIELQIRRQRIDELEAKLEELDDVEVVEAEAS